MKKVMGIYFFAIVLMLGATTMAHANVVVIPLMGGNKKIDIDKNCVDPLLIKDNAGDWVAVCATRTVFLSSIRITGNIGGLAGADAQCNTLASAAGLQGTFKAWLSDSTASVSSRFSMNPENVYRDTNNAIIANTSQDLLDGTIDKSIRVDEYGTTRTVYWVWTATSQNGSADELNSCSDWTNNTSTYGRVGSNTETGNAWTFGGVLACTNPAYIYCFEQ